MKLPPNSYPPPLPQQQQPSFQIRLHYLLFWGIFGFSETTLDAIAAEMPNKIELRHVYGIPELKYFRLSVKVTTHQIYISFSQVDKLYGNKSSYERTRVTELRLLTHCIDSFHVNCVKFYFLSRLLSFIFIGEAV